MAYAACRRHAPATEGTTAVILCGGNVGADKLRQVLGSADRSGRAGRT
jgi:hypothetical protein